MHHLNISSWTLLLLYWLLLCSICSPIPTQQTPKSVVLKSSQPSANGASIQILKDTTESVSNQWEITPMDQIGFHLELQLDESWSFDPLHRSRLSLQILSSSTNLAILADSVSTSFPSHDLLLSFSYNNAHYLSSAVSLQTDSAPLIFPKCIDRGDDSLVNGNVPLATGNVEAIISSNSTKTRIAKVMITEDVDVRRAVNQSSSSDPSNAQFVLSKESESMFIFDHYPNESYFRFTSNDHDNCAFHFNASQHTLHPLTVYIAALQIGNPVDILSIEVLHQIWSTNGNDTNSNSVAVDISNPNNNNGGSSDPQLIDHIPSLNGWSDWFGFAHWFLLVIYIVILMAATLTLLDKTHSKLPNGLCCLCCGCHRLMGCHASDQRNSFSIFLFGLAATNIMTDIYLSWMGCIYFIETESADLKILIIDLCSFIFIMIPYCINIVAMTKIHNLKTQSNGPRNWFERHFLFFAVLEFISCDSYLSLKLVKSHLFGMDLFDSGHSSLDLKRIRATKLATICTQNLPQILVQLAFGVMMEDVTPIIIVSIFLSAVLSLPFLISWSWDGLRDRTTICKEYEIYAMLIKPKSSALGITSDTIHEISSIQRHAARKELLRSKLSAVLCVDIKTLEIGYIEINEELRGCKIHIIQRVECRERDVDIAALYHDKYRSLGRMLKEIYHISLEWGLFCALEGVHGVNGNGNGIGNGHNHKGSRKGTSSIGHIAMNSRPRSRNRTHSKGQYTNSIRKVSKNSSKSMRNFSPIPESQALKRMIVDVLPQEVELEHDSDSDDDDVVDGQMTTDYDVIKYDEISAAESESESDDGESSDFKREQPLKIMVHDDQGHHVIQHDHHFVMDDNAKSKSGSVLEISYPSEEMAEPNSLDIGDDSQCGASTEVAVTEVAAAHNPNHDDPHHNIMEDEDDDLYGDGDEYKMDDFDESIRMIRSHREGRPDIHTRSNSHDCSTNMSLLREPATREPTTQRKSTWDSGVSDLFGVGGNEPGYNPFTGGTRTSVVTFTSPGMSGMSSIGPRIGMMNRRHLDYHAVDSNEAVIQHEVPHNINEHAVSGHNHVNSYGVDGNPNHHTTTMGITFDEDDDDSSDSPSNIV